MEPDKIGVPPTTAIPKQAMEPAAGQMTTQIITPKRPKIPKPLLAVILIIFLLGAASFALIRGRVLPAPGTEPGSSKQHVFEEFPNFPGIPINERTVSFVKADGKFCLLYKGVVYLPQDSGALVPKSKEETEEMASFPWIGLVDAPADVGEIDQVFSFKDSPSNNSFVFIMRWGTARNERYHMYRFYNNKFSQLKIFSQEDGLYYVPKLNLFSLGGNFLNLSMFRCPDCLSEQPETLLYYIPTGETRNIGKVVFFEWTEDDNVYRYKPFEEGVDPAQTILRTNEFFTESQELLTP